LTDVYPSDGGLIILPCSHKSNFDCSRQAFYPDYPEGGDSDYFTTEVPEGVLNITPRAGDVVVISELVTHGALSWVPEDRDRCFLTLRYMQQYESVRGGLVRFSPEVCARLSPETLQLAEPASFGHIKEIVEREVVTLS
jgi:hypothetical protein